MERGVSVPDLLTPGCASTLNIIEVCVELLTLQNNLTKTIPVNTLDKKNLIKTNTHLTKKPKSIRIRYLLQLLKFISHNI